MALALCCRFCNSLNCKALGQNTMCYDCGRLAENTLKLVPVKTPEPVTPAVPTDVTSEGHTPDPALVAAVAAATPKKAAPKKAVAAAEVPAEKSEAEEDAEIEASADEADFAAALGAIDEPAIEPLPEDSPLKP